MADDIPQWAIDRAVELVNADGSHYCAESVTEQQLFGYSLGKAFARYIASKEQPPLDPLVTALADLGTGFNDLPLSQSAAFLRESLGKRGFKIVPSNA